MKKELIIFDMDGTLVDSSLTIAYAINYVREKLNLAPLDLQHIVEKVNDHTLNPAQYFYEVETFTKDHEQWFSEYYTDNHKRELVLYDGIKELLGYLKENDFKLAIATNAYRGSTIESLTHLGVYDLFDSIACHDDVPQGKPYPDMLHKVLNELNITAQKSLFIGDGSRDEMASKRANIEYIMVNWGFSEYTDALLSVEALHIALQKHI